jgi:hypothetical protein
VLSFVKRAAALRAKYRAQTVTGNDRRCLEPSLVAAHPLNRNGVRANGQRCEELVIAAEKEFARRKITFCKYKVSEYLKMPEGGPKLIHGFRSTMYPAKAHFENWGECLHGHCHTKDEHTARHIQGGKAFSVACMADLDKLTYSDRQPAKLGHRNGFLYGIINTKTGDWAAWQVTQENGTWISPQGIL